MPANPPSGIDALPPLEMALACADAGATKAGRDSVTLLLLGILAGAFISLGAVGMITVMTGAGALPWGLARAAGGVTFSLGLILVIVGGAELFTGDCLMVIAWASRRIKLRELWRAWGLVYTGNLIGAACTACLVFLAAHYRLDGGLAGSTALTIATSKAALSPGPLFFLAILCNVLVCLAVWMALSARSTTDKVIVIVPAVTAFVAAGFEHSIANAFFLPYALLIKAFAAHDFWESISRSPETFAALTSSNTVINIMISTLGNLIGGSVMVGGIYWMIYLRRR
jgi:hypothetical protein